MVKFKNQSCKQRTFCPTEIIFSVTDKCNLKCAHCFVQRQNLDLQIEPCKALLKNCSLHGIDHIGFSGGEPFLNLNFITQIVKEAVNNDLLFDRIITNGIWWKNEKDLQSKLNELYKAGFDGHIGLSYDSFHAQPVEQIASFINAVHSIWQQEDILDIQSVISQEKEKNISDIQNLKELAKKLDCSIDFYTNKKTGLGLIIMQNDSIQINIQREPQSFLSSNPNCWKAKKWFKDDYCEGPGQILFIHPNGKVAPCCGFANENNELIIGTVSEGLEQILQNAKTNKMIKICYEEGLSKQIKRLKKNLPGRTQDICAFCDYVCKHLQ